MITFDAGESVAVLAGSTSFAEKTRPLKER